MSNKVYFINSMDYPLFSYLFIVSLNVSCELANISFAYFWLFHLFLINL